MPELWEIGGGLEGWGGYTTVYAELRKLHHKGLVSRLPGTRGSIHATHPLVGDLAEVRRAIESRPHA